MMVGRPLPSLRLGQVHPKHVDGRLYLTTLAPGVFCLFGLLVRVAFWL